MNNPRTVHVIFKTHLDVGFTDFAKAVVQRYIAEFIPNAIRVARELRGQGDPGARFVWTTGSWLVHTFLEQADASARKELEDAICAGDIRWHALPFTTHTELMTPRLLRHGLGLSRELDRRFGVTTLAAKMTDVPGHTRGIVPLLAEAGVEFLHIGVNPACSAPAVPEVFRWRDPGSGAAVTVMYHKNNYGGEMRVPGVDDAIVFAHTGDNHGPQSAEQITAQFARIREKFPGAEARASTLDAFAAALRPVVASLPVVEQEIGDTWIYGAGSDPVKVARFRALQRLLDQWGDDEAARVFARKLLPVPEHTWGMDAKTHLGDFCHYPRERFAAARERDTVETLAPAPHHVFARGDRAYSRVEASWAEQRAYLDHALETLPAPLRREADAALADTRPAPPDTRGVAWLEPGAPMACETPRLKIRFNPETGAIVGCATPDGAVWVDNGAGLGLLRYQTFSAIDYARYLSDYCVDVGRHASWIIPDVTRLGLAPADCPSATFFPRVARAGRVLSGGNERWLFELAFDATARRRFGAPEACWLEYVVPADRAAFSLRASWFGKPANFMPEAMWCSFRPDLPQADWRLAKLGGDVSPLDVVGKGGRNLHAVQDVMTCASGGRMLVIETLDAPLVSPGRPRLLEFDDTLPALSGGMHVNLHNNLYCTNFPLWFSDDAQFRFNCVFQGADSPSPPL